MTMTAAEATKRPVPSGCSAPDWRVTPAGTVPVADVARATGAKYGAIDYVIRACEVPIVDQYGQGRARYISLSDALLILAAASLAIVAGVAISQMVRAMKATGATVDGGALMIPLRSPA